MNPYSDEYYYYGPHELQDCQSALQTSALYRLRKTLRKSSAFQNGPIMLTASGAWDPISVYDDACKWQVIC